MKLSINQHIINKNETNAHQSKGFEPFDLTPQQFADHIQRGHAFSFQYKNSYRKADNFLFSDFIAADIDEGLTLDEALSDEFIINNACIIYTTASHTPEVHRFRLVFQTPRTITDRETMQAAMRGLIRKFHCDATVKDAARQFYGSRDCEIHVFDKVMSNAEFDLLLELGKQPLKLSDSPNKFIKATALSDLQLAPDQQVTTANGDTKPLQDMENSQPIYCPFHRDSKPSAFTTRSRNGAIGIHCSACQLTFWPKDKVPPPYDFFAFDKIAEDRAAQPPDMWVHESQAFDVEVPNPNRLLSQQYLRPEDIEQVDGITLIKSPKGSGKTEYLKYLVEQCKTKKLSVLLIGHRRALIRSLAARLGLSFYLDTPPIATTAKYYAISVDSLATMLDPAIHKYNVILIDESEQVFSHLLSDTMDNDVRRRSYLLLQHYVQVAHQVVALDADLNEVTMHAIQRFSENKPFLDRRFILNRYPINSQSIEVYADEDHLIEDLFIDIQAGKRVFVGCNTKKQVEALTLVMLKMFGETFPVLSITSENSGSDAAIAFVNTAANEALKYQVIIVSPAVGTGIDITFPEKATHIDAVYGLFQPLINTHYDIDQQISRVRHPGTVRVWVTPQAFNFETEVDPIAQELAASGLFPHVLTGYTRKGTPEFNWFDPFIRLYATIFSSQRASKNQMKVHFKALREHNGWSVKEIARDKTASARGKEIATLGREIRLAILVREILDADPLTEDEVGELIELRGQTPLSQEQDRALERYFIEQFYRTPVTAELIALDNERNYREQIRRLESILAYDIRTLSSVDPNHPHRLLFEILHGVGIVPEHTIDEKKIISMPRLFEFSRYCIDNKTKIERILNIEVRADVRDKPTSQLKRFLQLCGLDLSKPKVFSTGKGKTYEYHIDPDKLTTAMTIVERRKKVPLATRTTDLDTGEATI